MPRINEYEYFKDISKKPNPQSLSYPNLEHQQMRFRFLLDLIEKKEEKVILDLGSGLKGLSHYLKQEGINFKREMSIERLDFLFNSEVRENTDDDFFGEFPADLPDEKIDTIFLCGVLTFCLKHESNNLLSEAFDRCESEVVFNVYQGAPIDDIFNGYVLDEIYSLADKIGCSDVTIIDNKHIGNDTGTMFVRFGK
jgi:SAM-dependent methyltransferase